MLSRPSDSCRDAWLWALLSEFVEDMAVSVETSSVARVCRHSCRAHSRSQGAQIGDGGSGRDHQTSGYANYEQQFCANPVRSRVRLRVSRSSSLLQSGVAPMMTGRMLGVFKKGLKVNAAATQDERWPTDSAYSQCSGSSLYFCSF